jgi:alanyl-tRNA synthetase
MRRAIRHGKKLGMTGPFLNKTVGFVVEQMREAYPDLVEKRAFIEKATLAEEEQFLRTLDRGLALLDEETAKLGASKTLPGEVAFKLYDTYGFPLDLTRVICTEKGLGVDEVGFEKAMDRQREMARKNWKGSGEAALDEIYLKLAADLKAKKKLPEFVGYESTHAESECLAILVPDEKGLKPVDFYTTPPLAATADSAEKAPIIQAIFAKTPFYGESGGQVGDHGRVISKDFEGEVIDAQKPVADLIVAHIRPRKGAIKLGGSYSQETDQELRALTARNHTATHLLHWALREVLGKHVKQAGSLVAPDLLRFDFSHFQPLTEDEIRRIEDMINDKIWKGDSVQKREMKKDQAIAAGAMAMFGEKYGDVVRVVSVGNFSTELCGGTHVDNSAEIHLFKIGGEQGIAAGVRRMTAYTSKGAFEYFRKRDDDLKSLRDKLKAGTVDEIPGRIDKLLSAEKDARKQLEQMQAKAASGEVDEMLARAIRLPGTRLVAAVCTPDAQGVKKLRDLSDRLKQKAPDAIIILGMKDLESDKASLLVAVAPNAPKKLNANEILKELAPLIEGKGGGKPYLAQAGGTKSSGLTDVLAAAQKLIPQRLQA